jgi:hypothetical protein
MILQGHRPELASASFGSKNLTRQLSGNAFATPMVCAVLAPMVRAMTACRVLKVDGPERLSLHDLEKLCPGGGGFGRGASTSAPGPLVSTTPLRAAKRKRARGDFTSEDDSDEKQEERN